MIRRREINLYKGEFYDILNLIFSKQTSTVSYIKEFEKKIAKYIGTKHAITTHTGRGAMMLLLDALNLKRGDEVIFPAYTLKDLIILVQKKGLNPVLIDIEKDSFNINPDLVEEKITKKTKAIVATHIFGLPCNIKKILKIAKKHKIDVIEDCCLAHGAEFEGKKVGSFGIAGFFSFHQIKLLSTFGGGIITTNDDKIANFIRKKTDKYSIRKKQFLIKVFLVYLEDFILKSPLFYIFSTLFYFKPTKKLFNNLYLSFSRRTRAEKSKYTNLQAFVGLKQIKSLDKRIGQKRKNANLLKKLLDRKIKVQHTRIDCKHSYYFFILKTESDSERIQRKLLSKGLDVGIKSEMTDDCTNLVKDFLRECPVTHDVFNSALQIPIYGSLTEQNIRQIANILNSELI